ncbi:MAG: hypothetical protein WAM14_02715 [Candidatus Nitrosopolaris sp.]
MKTETEQHSCTMDDKTIKKVNDLAYERDLKACDITRTAVEMYLETNV